MINRDSSFVCGSLSKLTEMVNAVTLTLHPLHASCNKTFPSGSKGLKLYFLFFFGPESFHFSNIFIMYPCIFRFINK